jgi:hypothetical protein
MRVKKIEGAEGVGAMTWSWSDPDGRATWEWVTIEGEAAIRVDRFGQLGVLDHQLVGRDADSVIWVRRGP